MHTHTTKHAYLSVSSQEYLPQEMFEPDPHAYDEQQQQQWGEGGGEGTEQQHRHQEQQQQQQPLEQTAKNGYGVDPMYTEEWEAEGGWGRRSDVHTAEAVQQQPGAAAHTPARGPVLLPPKQECEAQPRDSPAVKEEAAEDGGGEMHADGVQGHVVKAENGGESLEAGQQGTGEVKAEPEQQQEGKATPAGQESKKRKQQGKGGSSAEKAQGTAPTQRKKSKKAAKEYEFFDDLAE